jgi:predicted  nucleic acid-binding Zn-ribbon protein|tara:strand:+ start:87 stop:662 length:576 start_codon:yes stop_codon:yes gene_type:complete
MSNENVETQTTSNENTETNPSTEASQKNVPYDRFQEVNQAKNDMANQVGKLQAQIDKMNADNKSKAEAKLVEDGKLKEALDLMTKERDSFKGQAEQWNSYQADKRESLMGKLTTDEDKSIAEGLSDLNKLETYVNKVTNVSAPSTSTARATTGKANEMGGYSSYAEWASKDPEGYKKANQTPQGQGIKIGY